MHYVIPILTILLVWFATSLIVGLGLGAMIRWSTAESPRERVEPKAPQSSKAKPAFNRLRTAG